MIVALVGFSVSEKSPPAFCEGMSPVPGILLGMGLGAGIVAVVFIDPFEEHAAALKRSPAATPVVAILLVIILISSLARADEESIKKRNDC